jgi:hypothetical protein
MIILSYPVKFHPGFHLITLLPQAKSMITLSYPVKFPPGFHLITLLLQAKSMITLSYPVKFLQVSISSHSSPMLNQ